MSWDFGLPRDEVAGEEASLWTDTPNDTDLPQQLLALVADRPTVQDELPPDLIETLSRALGEALAAQFWQEYTGERKL
jgi:hypothetical protein